MTDHTNHHDAARLLPPPGWDIAILLPFFPAGELTARQARLSKAKIRNLTGEPMFLPRHRTRMMGGIATSHPDPRQARWSQTIQSRFQEATAGAEGWPIREEPLILGLVSWRSCPKADHRRSAPTPERVCVGKPDLTNRIKIFEDSLNGLAWVDDSQIVGYWPPVAKFIAAQGDPPRTWLAIYRHHDHVEAMRSQARLM